MGMELFVSIDSGNHTNAALTGVVKLVAFLRFCKKDDSFAKSGTVPC